MSTRTWRAIRIAGSLFALLLLCVWISLNTGYSDLSLREIWTTLFGGSDMRAVTVIFDIRLPRILIAVLVGMAFAVAGVVLQGISQNGLADSGVLGINAGAGLGIVLYISAFYEKTNMAPVYALPIFAFIGALGTAVAVFALSLRQGRVDPVRLVLMGIAVGAGIGAAMLFLTYYMGTYQYEFVKVWLTGNIWGTNWDYVRIAAVWIAVVLTLVIYKSRSLNLLQLGDAVAMSVGMAVNRERLLLLAAAVALAGAAVSVAGAIGFVGLVGPHMARRLVGTNHKAFMPIAALVGALLVVLSDLIGRIIVHPSEIPVGVIVSGIGAPYFIYLMIKRRKPGKEG
jgi:iron complex transport system permease protein